MKYILTIDDDEALCKLVKKCIETEQVPVYTFLRGEDALSFFYQNQSDCVLVILDIMLGWIQRSGKGSGCEQRTGPDAYRQRSGRR